MPCYHCHKEVEGKVGFREECLHCQADLHTCLNCRFHDPSAYNECCEPSAKWVRDKEQNNYCEYFELRDKKSLGCLTDQAKTREELLKTADRLFKKSY